MTPPVPASSRPPPADASGPRRERAGPARTRGASAAYLDLSDRIRTTQVAATRDDDRARAAPRSRSRAPRHGSVRCSTRYPNTATRSSARWRSRSPIPKSRTRHAPGARAHPGHRRWFRDLRRRAGRRDVRLPAPTTQTATTRPRAKPSAAETRRRTRLAELDSEEPRADDELASARAELKQRAGRAHERRTPRARGRTRTRAPAHGTRAARALTPRRLRRRGFVDEPQHLVAVDPSGGKVFARRDPAHRVPLLRAAHRERR